MPLATLMVSCGPVGIRFDNRDAGVPHNLVLMAGPDLTTELVKSEIITGPATQDVKVPGLMPGACKFTCSVHPNMTARLTIGG